MLALMEFNDAGILTFLGDRLVSESPGYAVMHENTLYVGDHAFKNNRLYPHWTNNRFWQHLDTEPIKNPQPQVRHHADLAFAHLEQIWKTIREQADEVIFAVPGGFSPEHIGLLVGMARECGIPVSGIVDSAIIKCRKLVTARQSVFLDISLHQITLTRMSKREHLTAEQTIVVSDSGLARLWERWANTVATMFIQNTRFDPMHDAGSEQLLYDRIPSWISKLNSSATCEFELDWSGNKHKITFSSEKLLAACAELYPAIVQQVRQLSAGGYVQLLLSHRFKGFPGLQESLALLKDCDVQQLDPMVFFTTVAEFADEIRSPENQLNFVTRLPIPDTEVTPQQAASTDGPPTHLLFKDLAVPIERAYKLAADWEHGLHQDQTTPLCTIYARGDALFMQIHDHGEITLNDTPVSGELALNVGDELKSGDSLIRLIRVQLGIGP